MISWLGEAAEELLALAESNPPGSGELAGNLYQLASSLNAERAADLAVLRNTVADIRYWDLGAYAIYFRIDGDNAYTVLHIGAVKGALRAVSKGVAIRRA